MSFTESLLAQIGGPTAPAYLQPGFVPVSRPVQTSTATATTSTGLTPDQATAQAQLSTILSSFGLAGLGAWAWEQYKNGSPVEQILLDMRSRPEYLQRFPAMSTLSAKGRAINEQQYIHLESQYAATAHAFGLPSGFYDSPDDFATFISNDVSPIEYRDRLQMFRDVAGAIGSDPQNTPVLTEMQRLYGIGATSGEFLAWVIDEDRALPLIENQVAAARTSSIANRSGYGSLYRSEAEQLVGAGVTDEQAAGRFAALGMSSELFTPLDAGESGIGRSQQIAFAAGDVNAQRSLENRARRRVAQFEGGSGFGAGNEGVSGLG